MKLTKRHARKVLEVVDAGLVSGLGAPAPGEMCVMAAINYALGHEHGDRPSCVHAVIREFDIALNDAAWSSSEARAKGMRREAIAKLGSTEIDGESWAKYVTEQTICLIVPISLRSAAELIPTRAESLQAAEGTQEAAKWAAAKWAEWDSMYWAAKSAAARAAWSAAEWAEWAAKSAAEWAEWAAKSEPNKQDEVLTLAAEIAVDACVKFKTQGSKWLDIVD